MATFPIADVWGIGRASQEKLAHLGIEFAGQVRDMDPKLARQRNIDALKGEIPSPINPPSGCTFRTRCRHAQPQCAETRPPLETLENGRLVACIRWREIEAEKAALAEA